MEQTQTQTETPAAVDNPAWRPLSPIQRRVAGVLVEKAKTTPDAYPMTVNAITNACNQKSNRSPLMDLASDDVQLALDELRNMGAVTEIQSAGRVAKYRHLMYQWLGVDKPELAVMAELLLRGEQTVGELRGRAARMEPISDLAQLQPILRRLVEKRLVVEVTPPGRGQLVTHGLFPSGETPADAGRSAAPQAVLRERVTTPSNAAEIAQRLAVLEQTVGQLAQQVQELRQTVERLRTS